MRQRRLFPPQDLGLLSAPDRADWNKPDLIMDALGIADGSVVAEYIVTADGGADIRSLQFLTATALPFVDAVLEVLPQYRYIPLAISGCPVASLVRMPFTFEIIR